MKFDLKERWYDKTGKLMHERTYRTVEIPEVDTVAIGSVLDDPYADIKDGKTSHAAFADRGPTEILADILAGVSRREEDRRDAGADVHDADMSSGRVPVAPLPEVSIHRGGLRRTRARIRHATLQVANGARQPVALFWYMWAIFIASTVGVVPWP